MELKKCVISNQQNGELAAAFCRRVISALQESPDMVEMEFVEWNTRGHYERLLSPTLLSAQEILTGVVYGVLPALEKNGWSLSQYIGILSAMGRAAVAGGEAPKRWLRARVRERCGK